MLASLQQTPWMARLDSLHYGPERRADAQIDEVQRPGGEFNGFLGREVFPEPLFVKRLELLDPLWRRLGEEEVMALIRHGHGDGLTAKAAGRLRGSAAEPAVACAHRPVRRAVLPATIKS